MKKETKKIELTSPQNNLLNLENFYSNSCINNVCGQFAFKNEDIELIKKAILLFLQSNDSFSLKLSKDKKIYKDQITEYNFEVIEFKNKNQLYDFQKNFPKYHFELYDNYLFKIVLIKFKKSIIVSCCQHHLISDAWTINLMISGICKIFEDLKQGKQLEYSFPSYFEYIENFEKYKNSKKYEKDLIYWNEVYKEKPSILSLKNGKKTSLLSNRYTSKIPSKMYSKILELCRQNNISDYIFFLTIFSIYFSKIYNKDKFVIGNPTLNRSNFKEKQTTGLFVNIMPFECDLTNSDKFLELAQKLATSQKQMYKHLNVLYEDIYEKVLANYDIKTDLYDIVISYQNFNVSSDSFWCHTPNQKESLQIHLKQIDNEMVMYLDYLLDVFDLQTIENMNKTILYLIDQVLENPQECVLSNLKLTTKSQKQQLEIFNNTKANLPNTNIVKEFEEQVRKNPNKIAIIDNDGKYSYAYINTYSNILANKIHEMNIENEVIRFSQNRNVNTIISILAILKSNNTYLPIDPNYPQKRISYMVEHSMCKLILTNEDIDLSFIKNNSITFLNISEYLYSKGYMATFDNPNLKISQNNLAYIMYTSGSTGEPKAVCITHKNVINFVNSVNKILGYNNDVVLSVTSICFDIFVFEVFPTLLLGQTLVIADNFQTNNPKLLQELISKHEITKILTTPSRINMLLNFKSELPEIKQYILGGEPLNLNLLQQLQKDKADTEKTRPQIFNFYRPTETCVYSTFKEVTNSNEITVGKPINNTQIYILNKDNTILPLNCVGEIAIAGSGVGQGYYNDEQRTNKSFITLPENNKRVYKTGDLGFIDNNLELHCLGRLDNQIKIHGFRIELQEITNNILKYPGIKKCITVLKEIPDKQTTKKIIVAYVESEKKQNFEDVKNFLQNLLPYYMIPNKFVQMKQLPLNLNYKIDSSKLPLPDETEDVEFEEPRNEIEKILKQVLEHTLELNKPISVTQDLFDLSIDSLDIIKIQTNLLDYDIKLNTQDFYTNRTIRNISKTLKKEINLHNMNEITEDEKFALQNTNNSFYKYPNIINFEKQEFSNIILYGSTGFLGQYLLHDILNTTNIQIICPIRTKGETAQEKLNKLYSFYFKQDLTKYFKQNRIITFSTEIISPTIGFDETSMAKHLTQNSLVINAAANVNYYGEYKEFKKINTDFVKYILEVQRKIDFKFVHISTLGISGNYLVTNNSTLNYFNENNFYINQNYKENVYVRSKFEAEQLIFNYCNTYDLKTSIFRVGNLTPDTTNSNFQIHATKNAFFNLILLMLKSKQIPNSILFKKLEFTPINECSKSILDLIFNLDFSKSVFHLFNNNKILIVDLLKTFQHLGYTIEIVQGNQYAQNILNLSKQNKNDLILKSAINDIDTNIGLNFENEVLELNDYTNMILNKLDFKWSNLDETYFSKMIKFIEKNNFLNTMTKQSIRENIQDLQNNDLVSDCLRVIAND